MKPHLNLTVDNVLSEEEGGKLNVDLHFKSLDDFSPDQVAEQVPALKKLLELRQELSDLRGTMLANEKLEEILQNTVNDEEKMSRIKAELEAEGGSDGGE